MPDPIEPAATTEPAAAPAEDKTDWKAEARKHEARAKENKAAADELAALKASQLTEAQKAEKALADARAELAKYQKRDEVAGWAKEITKDSPVPPDALRGSTREELEAHHTQLASLITGKPAIPKPATPPGKSPAERGGATGSRAAAAVRALRGAQ